MSLEARLALCLILPTLLACSSAAKPTETADAQDSATADDTGSSTPSDANDSSSPDDAGGCPSFASECPTGCFEDRAQHYDPTGSCLPAVTTRCIPFDTGCTGAFTCLARISTGELYLFSQDCHDDDDWRDCTAAEAAEVDAGTDCMPF